MRPDGPPSVQAHGENCTGFGSSSSSSSVLSALGIVIYGCHKPPCARVYGRAFITCYKSRAHDAGIRELVYNSMGALWSSHMPQAHGCSLMGFQGRIQLGDSGSGSRSEPDRGFPVSMLLGPRIGREWGTTLATAHSRLGFYCECTQVGARSLVRVF